MNRPILGIIMGDPASIGPEISVKALANAELYEKCRPIVIGDAKVMENAVKIVGMEGKVKIHSVKNLERRYAKLCLEEQVNFIEQRF